jgi:hypothetical protein
MAELKPKACYGYDNIPVKILIDGITYLLSPFHKLLNMTYNQKVIPEQWKTSRIIPLHKKDLKTKSKTTGQSQTFVLAQKSLKD